MALFTKYTLALLIIWGLTAQLGRSNRSQYVFIMVPAAELRGHSNQFYEFIYVFRPNESHDFVVVILNFSWSPRYLHDSPTLG